MCYINFVQIMCPSLGINDLVPQSVCPRLYDQGVCAPRINNLVPLDPRSNGCVPLVSRAVCPYTLVSRVSATRIDDHVNVGVNPYKRMQCHVVINIQFYSELRGESKGQLFQGITVLVDSITPIILAVQVGRTNCDPIGVTVCPSGHQSHVRASSFHLECQVAQPLPPRNITLDYVDGSSISQNCVCGRKLTCTNYKEKHTPDCTGVKCHICGISPLKVNYNYS